MNGGGKGQGKVITLQRDTGKVKVSKCIKKLLKIPGNQTHCSGHNRKCNLAQGRGRRKVREHGSEAGASDELESIAMLGSCHGVGHGRIEATFLGTVDTGEACSQH